MGTGFSDIAYETDDHKYEGQGRPGTKIKHGRGVCTWKGANAGIRYEGEWKDDKMSGQGVRIWPSGDRYEGEYKDDLRCSRGVHWLPGGRVFDGAWAECRPLQGTAMEPDCTFSRATFDGKTILYDGTWDTAERAPGGRVVSGGPPAQGGSGGARREWEAEVAMADGTTLRGAMRGLSPHGPATLVERGGATYAAEYDGSRTVAEGPVPVRKQVRRPAARARALPSDG
jgi:hypothetical protein